MILYFTQGASMKRSDTYESKEYAPPAAVTDSRAAMQDDVEPITGAKRARDGNDSVTSSSSAGGDTVKKAKVQPSIKKDGSFKDLVTQSTIFADKSLFIKTVMEDDITGLLIAMPRRWGKTVNLDMLKRFLAIPVDSSGKPVPKENTDNYKIFHEQFVLQPDGSKSSLKISRSKLLMTDPQNMFGGKKEVDALEVQGTYPVIYIDFKNCKAGNFDSVQAKVKTALSESFDQHAYLQDNPKLSEHERNLVKQYLTESNDVQVEQGLKFLSKFLFKHHGQKVWVLIDEYDAVLNAAYQNQHFTQVDLHNTILLFKSLYETALKGNQFLEKAVVTGIQFIAKASAGSGLNNLQKIDVTNPKYAPYYALSQKEFVDFCKHFGVPEEYFQDAKKWYDGYRVQDDLANKYNVWSIISYLRDVRDTGNYTNFKSYWEESGNISFLQKLFKSKNVQEKIEQLVDDKDGDHGTIIFERESNFSDEDFMTLKDMMGGNKEITQGGMNILFSYLFILGYLTIDGKTENHYQIPNMEIKHEMGKRLIEHYQTICTVDPAEIQTLTDTLQQVMDVKGSNDQINDGIRGSFRDFYNQFKVIVQGIRLVNDKNAEGIFTNEDIVHSILNYIVLQTQHSSFGSEVYTSKLHSDAKGRADIKITNEDVGIIIEVKCVPVPAHDNGHMKEAIEQAIGYCNLLNTDNKIFVAINVDKGKKTTKPAERAIELLCASDMNDHDNQTVFGIDTLGNDSTFGVTDDVFNSMVDDAI